MTEPFSADDEKGEPWQPRGPTHQDAGPSSPSSWCGSNPRGPGPVAVTRHRRLDLYPPAAAHARAPGGASSPTQAAAHMILREALALTSHGRRARTQ